VFSSIDHRGRYSYGNQSAIAQWNLARLAECLLPLMQGEGEEKIARATAVINGFTGQFDAAFLQQMRLKLGLTQSQPGDTELVHELLRVMHAARAANPAFIPRNHRVEAALDAASSRNDMAPFNVLLAMVQRPFDDHPGFEAWMLSPADHERVLATFCGT
jgi:uncharacterized protein YdiU (UPF0061 family)